MRNWQGSNEAGKQGTTIELSNNPKQQARRFRASFFALSFVARLLPSSLSLCVRRATHFPSFVLLLVQSQPV
jgi:hypothetical protein